MTRFCLRLTLIVFLHGVFGDLVKLGDSVTMSPGIIKQQSHRILWYFEDGLIALINQDPRNGCLFEGEGGRFRDRLVVDHQTGSLTIRNFSPEHIGRYEAQIIRGQSGKPTDGKNGNCDSTKDIPKNIKLGEVIKTYSLTTPILKRSGNYLLNQPSEENSPWFSSVLRPAPSAAVFAGLCAALLVFFVI